MEVGGEMPSSGRRLLADTDTGFVKSRGAENVLNCLPRQRSSTRLTPGPGSRRQDLHSSCARCLSSHRRNLIITCSLCGFRVHGSCAYPPVNNAVAKLVASKSVGWHCWACKQEAAILQQFDITVRSCKKRWADEFCQDCGELAGAPSVNCEVCHSAFHRTCVREFEQRDGWRCRPCRPRDADPAVTMDKWAVELVCEADRYIPVIRGVNLSQPSQPWRTSEVVFRLSRAVLITRTGRIVWYLVNVVDIGAAAWIPVKAAPLLCHRLSASLVIAAEIRTHTTSRPYHRDSRQSDCHFAGAVEPSAEAPSIPHNSHQNSRSFLRVSSRFFGAAAEPS
mmetsp:Transcript_47024/g.124573  ORF Transcript_47024/g.124573 Transcript_47024/m.124573 type:complete len:336 (+) Transcript_47024:74-1081(+)